MESEAPLATGTPIESALRELRDAIDQREAEHARRNSYRVLFSRAVLLFFLGIFLGLVILGRDFDLKVFRARLLSRIQIGAPLIVSDLRSALAQLIPLYRSEVGRSLATFSQNIEGAIGQEAARMGDALVPLTTGDLPALTRRSSDALAHDLLKEFGPELGNDPEKALALAKAIRAEQLRMGGAEATRAAVLDMSDSLKSLGTADPTAFRTPEMAALLTNAALDTTKEKILAGQVGFDAPPARPAASAAKGGL
jgi:hypothetical protein